MESEQSSITGVEMIGKIIGFIQLFVCPTLAKRLVALVLLAAGLSNNRVTELTGVCDRTVRSYRSKLLKGETDGLFSVGSGRGFQCKLEDISSAIIEEIERGDYHSQQQIADMVDEKFGVKTSRQAIGRLLKKTGYGG